MQTDANDDFGFEEITRTISGVANAIASGNAADLVFEDATDARVHATWTGAASQRTACVVVR